MSEMDIYKILSLNYYKKLPEWWTDEVDGDCISFILYRNTENSVVLVKKMERRFQKRRVLPNLSTVFYVEELTEIEWSISEKQNNGRVYETKLGDKEHQFECCFELDTNTNSRFVRLSFNRLSKFNRLSVVYITIYQKQTMKMCILVIFPLVRNRTN